MSSTPNMQPQTHGDQNVLVTVDELARRKGVTPKTIDDLAVEDNGFDGDDELDAFLSWVTEQRHENLT